MTAQFVDVLIMGAGLSGIGAAVHLQKDCPSKSYLILEGRNAMGGTWDLFRYPGIRSDSDMYTLGYNFKPWTNPKSIADGESIRQYIKDTAQEYGVERHIRYGHKVLSADWDSVNAQWKVQVDVNGEQKEFHCNFFLSCSGYYNYAAGYEPEFNGRDQFKGQVIHPQHWPEDLDYTGKKVVVIGSGATAVTLVPSMADKASHVTMLQRSPSYVVGVPEKDHMSNKLREYLPDTLVYRLARTRNVALGMGLYGFSRFYPEKMRNLVQGHVEKAIGPNVDMKHFTPKYNPWDERLCAVPNGDLFRALRKGKVSVVTDHIDAFTEKGILLKSGEKLDADIIVTATGLDIQILGGMSLSIDGIPYDVSKKMYYKGLMFEDLPNFGMVFGYTNASWTLKADLISEFVCRLLKHMDKKGLRQVTPRNHGDVEHIPFVDMSSGYIQRALAKVPRQGSKAPWKLYQNYVLDLLMLRYGRLLDGSLEFSHPAKSVSRSTASSAVA